MASPSRHTFHAVPRGEVSGDSYKRSAPGTEATVPGNLTLRHVNFHSGIAQDLTCKPFRVPENLPSPSREIVARPGFSPRPHAEFKNPLVQRPLLSLIEAVGIGGENVVASTEHLQREIAKQDEIIEDLLAKVRAEEIYLEELEKTLLTAKQRQQASAFAERQAIRQTERVKNEVICLQTRNSGLKKKAQSLISKYNEELKQLDSTIEATKKEKESCIQIEQETASKKKLITVEESKRQELLEKIRDIEKQRNIVIQKLKAAEKREEEVTRTVVDALVLVKQPLRESMGVKKKVAVPAFKC